MNKTIKQVEKDIITKAFENIPLENKKYISRNLMITERIFAELRSSSMDILDLAMRLDLDSDVMRAMLTGFYNFTLREMTNIEVALEIDLLN